MAKEEETSFGMSDYCEWRQPGFLAKHKDNQDAEGRPLARHYWLESLDRPVNIGRLEALNHPCEAAFVNPKARRPSTYLREKFEIWRHQFPRASFPDHYVEPYENDFINWLNTQEANTLKASFTAYCAENTILQQDQETYHTWLGSEAGKAALKNVGKRIHYWSLAERKPHKAKLRTEVDGTPGHPTYTKKIYVDMSDDAPLGKICNTTNYHSEGKSQGYGAYVITSNGNLYIHEHTKGLFAHASFNSGEKVRAAGLVRVENGKIVDIDNFSGHYQPTLLNLYAGVKHIGHEFFAKNGTVTYREVRFPGLLKSLTNSQYSLVRLLGRGIGNFTKNYHFKGRDAFLAFADKELTKRGIRHEPPRVKVRSTSDSSLVPGLVAPAQRLDLASVIGPSASYNNPVFERSNSAPAGGAGVPSLPQFAGVGGLPPQGEPQQRSSKLRYK